MKHLLPTFAFLLAAGCNLGCEVDGPLSYDDPDLWLCRPGAEDGCADDLVIHDVAADGTVTRRTVAPAVDADVACFVVYPTVDLRLGVTLHHDTTSVAQPERWVTGQAGSLGEVCRIWAPVYRQVTIGTYVALDDEVAQTCFDAAFADVAAAFDAFLEAEPDRDIVLFGHSQGGQHLSRLLRERFDGDPALQARLRAAYPLGWSLGTDVGSTTGGSFEAIPTCTAADERGCVIGYRSYQAGRDRPEAGDRLEGDAQVCTNPATPDQPADGTGLLAAFTARAGDVRVRLPKGLDADPDDLVRWPGGHDARCEGPAAERALAVRWVRDDAPPADLDGLGLGGSGDAHGFDVNLGVADVVQDIRRRE